ncbi:MAG TPA: aspartate aminotransferase family protein [Gemmatimonadales bacterium]|nr:aspartate aminotransferase family protein [Gemmatimonadales bacterium]
MAKSIQDNVLQFAPERAPVPPGYHYPDGNVFYRKLNRVYDKIVRGEGCFLIDSNGKRYLDGSGGAFVANLGHGIAEIGEAMARQAGRVAYLNGTAFTSDAVEEFAAELTALAPGDLDHAYFLGSGSEAVEASLKLARQYWVEQGKLNKRKIIALKPGYHGNTLLALSASAREHYKTYYQGWLVEVVRIPAPYAYRCDCENAERGTGHGECPVCSGAVLEEAILKEGAENVAAFIAEPVGGSSTGASVPGPDYFKRVREICDRHQVLFIADEVLVGAGRTGTWSAIEQYDVVPDIMTMGKGIGGGYAPVSSVLAPRRILDVIAKGSGAFMHAQTFSHHPVLAAGGLAALRYLKQHNLVERCARMGAVFHHKLQALRLHEAVGDVRGRGLLAGVEFVEDRESRRPFPRKKKFAETFTEAALRAGLVIWPNTGQAEGEQGDLAMLAPPFTITEQEIDLLVSLFEQALNDTLRTIA